MEALLSASSLILAALAALVALWSGEVQQALALKIPAQKANAKLPLKTVRAAFWTKVLPLTCFVIASIAIFVPDLVSVVSETVRHTSDPRYKYDAIKAAFALTVLAQIAIGIYLVGQLVRLSGILAKRRT
ncbi:hypothetical protein DSM05_05295 [Pseudomonas sp. FW305-3-2-15-E-TSA4]|nr:hypothetical protein [Pseudomonas sp. FW305-3-2-15-E-TSA4]